MSIDKTKGLESRVDQTVTSDATKISLSANRKKATSLGVESLIANGQDSIDRVSVSGGLQVQSLLDPQKTAEDQKAKVERLKKLVQSGQYKTPDSLTLAQSVAGEINVEMLSGSFIQFSDD